MALGLGRAGWLGLVRELTLYLFLPLPALLGVAAALGARFALALALPPLAMFAYLYAPLFLPHTQPPAEGPSFRMLSFNAGGNAGGGRAPPLLAALSAVNADLVALQEVPRPTLDLLRAELAAEYPYQAGTPDAVALSRFPLGEPSPVSLRERGYTGQRLTVQIGSRGLTLTNVHVTRPSYRLRWRRGILPLVQGFDPGWRDAEVAELVERLEETPGARLLTGDFNESEWSWPYQQLHATLGDSFREAGWGFGHTYPSTVAWGNWRGSLPVLRIDYVFHSSELVARSAQVGPDGGSDHLPVVAELAFR